MHIKYDKYELFELFENDPIYISCEETGMCIYSKETDNEVGITLNLSIYENKCNVTIYIHGEGVFEATLDNVEYLQAEGDGLRIHQNNSEKDYVIYFKPNLFVKVIST